MNRISWIINEIKWFIVRIFHVLTGKYFLDKNRYGKRVFHSVFDTSREIANRIESGKPFAYGRESFVEFDSIIRCKTKKYFGISTLSAIGQEYRGIFTIKDKTNRKDEGLFRFAELMEESLHDIDILGVWKSLAMADAYVDEIDNDCIYIGDAVSVEPYSKSAYTWTKALTGKKVLVISPFYREIQKQYDENREKLWDDKEMLPKFELKAINSVWHLGKEGDMFDDWFDALDYLYDEALKEDFDIALLGCGPFGFPLAAKLKRAGKQAIHMGGCIQILFGIKGKRWDDTLGKEYYNEYWIRPYKPENMNKFQMLDKGCYW